MVKRYASAFAVAAVAIILIVGLAVLAAPQLAGHFTKDGKVPLLVGVAGKIAERRILALWVHIESECGSDIDGLVPPYYSVTIYIHCLFPDDLRVPRRPMRLTIRGGEGPDALPHVVSVRDARVRADAFESDMLDNPIPGYRGITIAPEKHAKSQGGHFLSHARFVSDSALAPVLHCILKWQVGTESDRVVGGSCFGFGRYKGVVFDTAFAVDRSLDKTTIEGLIRAAIDEMVIR